MPSYTNSNVPPSPPDPPWTVARVQTALEEMGCCLLLMSDDLEALNRRALLLLPPEPELTAMLEGEIPPTLAVEVQGCIECVKNDYLPLTIEAMQHAATATVAMLLRDFRSTGREGVVDEIERQQQRRGPFRQGARHSAGLPWDEPRAARGGGRGPAHQHHQLRAGPQPAARGHAGPHHGGAEPPARCARPGRGLRPPSGGVSDGTLPPDDRGEQRRAALRLAQECGRSIAHVVIASMELQAGGWEE